MNKVLTALALGTAVTLGGCNFVSHAHGMGGTPITMTPQEKAKHEAILAKVRAKPVAVAAKPKAAPLPKARPRGAPTRWQLFKAALIRKLGL